MWKATYLYRPINQSICFLGNHGSLWKFSFEPLTGSQNAVLTPAASVSPGKLVRNANESDTQGLEPGNLSFLNLNI